MNKQKHALDSLIDCYAQWVIVDNPLLDAECRYQKALSIVKGASYTADNIKMFCSTLTSLKSPMYSGLYISAIVNNVIKEDDVFTINTGLELDNLAYRHSKGFLGIIGTDTGWCTGRQMSGGMVAVRENAGYYAGESMSGGVLLINGNSGSLTGYKMSGGKIVVMGKIQSAGSPAGGKMLEVKKKDYVLHE